MKKVLVIIVSLCLALALVACDKEAKIAKNSDKSVSAIEQIKAKGKIVMLTDASFPPYEYISGSGYDGIDIALGKIIAETLGVELEIIAMNFDLIPDAVNTDKGDFIAAGFSITDERKAVVEFTTPYVESYLLMVVAADSPIVDIKELTGKKVSVQEASISDFYVTDNNITNSGNILRFKNVVDACNAVVSGKADACIADELPAKTLIENNNGKLKSVPSFSVSDVYAMATKKGNTELAEYMSNVLADMKKQGKIEELIKYYMKEAANFK